LVPERAGLGLVAAAVSSLLYHPTWWIGLIVIALAWVGGDGGYNRVLWRKASGNWHDSGVLPGERRLWWTWFHPNTAVDWWRFAVCVVAAVVTVYIKH